MIEKLYEILQIFSMPMEVRRVFAMCVIAILIFGVIGYATQKYEEYLNRKENEKNERQN